MRILLQKIDPKEDIGGKNCFWGREAPTEQGARLNSTEMHGLAN